MRKDYIFMGNLPGVFSAKTKSGKLYFRSSITYQRKHISLGSYAIKEEAHQAHLKASQILNCDNIYYEIDQFKMHGYPLSFDKWVMLINLKDNGMYCRNPIYLKSKYFLYYLDVHTPLKFDVDDLFYFMEHKIMCRGGHLFVAEYGMQINVLSRFGIKNYAVAGRDFRFINGDTYDFRYQNIQIINRYHGVVKEVKKGKELYCSKIHINGDFIIGRYPTEVEAAIAYNKAANLLCTKGIKKDFPKNYIDSCNEIEYAKTYNALRISKKLRNLEVNT